MNRLRLGVLGMSEGNGHPYSWSAIFNGYNPEVMAKCPFPVIPEYLGRQRFPEDSIADADVTHVWAQDRKTAEHIAEACLIGTVAGNPQEMIGYVDAVLLARDDADLHWTLSRPFIEAGLPVFIDKPLALSVEEARRILEAQKWPGQVYSCSALAFSQDLMLSDEVRESVGKISTIEATIMKDWDRYAVHVIEPVLRILDPADRIEDVVVGQSNGRSELEASWASGLKTRFVTTGKATGKIEMHIEGDRGTATMRFGDTFASFKRALEGFVESVRTKKPAIDERLLLSVIDLVERGRHG